MYMRLSGPCHALEKFSDKKLIAPAAVVRRHSFRSQRPTHHRLCQRRPLDTAYRQCRVSLIGRVCRLLKLSVQLGWFVIPCYNTLLKTEKCSEAVISL